VQLLNIPLGLGPLLPQKLNLIPRKIFLVYVVTKQFFSRLKNIFLATKISLLLQEEILVPRKKNLA